MSEAVHDDVNVGLHTFSAGQVRVAQTGEWQTSRCCWDQTEQFGPVFTGPAVVLFMFLTRLSWSRCRESHYNLPEEHDETVSTMGQKASDACSPGSACNPADHSIHPEFTTLADDDSFGMVQHPEHGHDLNLPPPDLSYLSYPRPHLFAVGYNQATPFPSQANGSWLHPSLASSWSGYPKSLPSCLNRKDLASCAGSDCLSGLRSLSLPGSPGASSLERPLSLCSNSPSASLRHHRLPPYSCQPQGAGCCAQCPAESFSRRAVPSKAPWPPYHPVKASCCKFCFRANLDIYLGHLGASFSLCSVLDPGNCRVPGPGCPQM